MKEAVSIEKVLNSRCSCDFDGNPRENHWGIFLKHHRLSQKIMDHVLQCCNAPQYSDGKLVTWFDEKYLFLGFKKAQQPLKTRMLHIESGMQHEAVYLACTALGIGTCIHNVGINGTEYEDKIATARHLILEKADCYPTGKFTTKTPGPEAPFKPGRNLPEPTRDGDVECLPELKHLTLFNNAGSSAEEKDVPQLLWAAKGRTPHYVKSRPWGLTIPTWGGGQGYTDVYLVRGKKLFRYVNWRRTLPFLRGNPTHDIEFLKNVEISSQLEGASAGIILSRNEKTSRALWEAGYMLENMFLQARSLGISYESKVFDYNEISLLAEAGIPDAVATVLL